MNLRRAERLGASNVELLVGMIILSIAAMAVARVVISQMRYYEHQKSAIQARSVPRGPLNRLVGDLRMIEATGGVVFASDTAVVVRAPYAMGITCTTIIGNTYVSILPVDSAMYDSPGFSGYAWRASNGVYAYVESGTPLLPLLDLNLCNIPIVSPLLAPGAKIVKIPIPLANPPLSLGTPVFLYGNFTSTITGGLISSLNVKLGQTVAANVADGVKTVKYDSCIISKALSSLGALVPLNNAWVDNWVEY